MNPLLLLLLLRHGGSAPAPKCPGCGAPEQIVQSCAACEYVYPPEEHSEVREFLGILAACIVGTWALMTVLFWAGDYHNPPLTLLDVLAEQVEFFGDLLHRIW